MKLLINKSFRSPLGKVNVGDIVEVKDDGNNIPLDRFWRNRIKDSKIDNCVETVKTTKKQTKKGN